MANKANLELQFLNLQYPDEIIMKQFLLVHFIDPRLKGTNIRSYFCLIWRYNRLQLNNEAKFLVKLSDKSVPSLKDLKYFYGEHSVLQQFWSSFRKLKSIKDFANSVEERNCSDPNLASSIIYKCYQNDKLDKSLTFYTIDEQENYDLIIFPIKNVLEFYNEKRKELIISLQNLNLDEIYSDPDLYNLESTFLPCFAFWIGWSEELEVKSYKSFHYDINYEVEISNDLQNISENYYIKINNFHTYFFLPHAFELDSQACNYPSLNKNEIFELERSYSQKRLSYFDEWEKLGIKSQTALRTHLGKKFVDYFRNRFKSVSFNITVIDSFWGNLLSGLYLTITTLIIAIIWEIGTNKFNDISTFQQLKLITPDALWFFMNLLIIFAASRILFSQNWFLKGSSFRQKSLDIGIVLYLVYYFLFIIFGLFLKHPIRISWLNKTVNFIFQRFVFVHLIMCAFLMLLVNILIVKFFIKRSKKFI